MCRCINKNNEQKAREYFYDGKAYGGSVKKYAQGGGVRKVRY